MYDQFKACGARTRFVLAGYSFGAWVVDLTLRDLKTTVLGKLILGQVAGAGVMGDPASPDSHCKKISTPRGRREICRQGVATSFGAGYPKDSEYRDNGLSKNFTAYCLVHSDTDFDPVCGMYYLSDVSAHVKAHVTGYRASGLATSLGRVLAGYAKQ